MDALIDRFGEGALLAACGALVGVVFGLAAYHARFCLRAATAEVAHGQLGPRLTIWLVAFCTALVAVQLAVGFGGLDTTEARQLAATGSISGAVLGGLMFGAGMILARGCVSRLLVLSASGNLRAIVTGLVVTLTAQAALSGALAPLRETLAGLWIVPGGPARSLVPMDGAALPLVISLAVGVLGAAALLGRRQGLPRSELLAAAVVGLTVYGGWQLTYLVGQSSFEVIAVESITFTGPSTDTLMALVNQRSASLDFGLGLVPGVFLGAFIAAVVRREARIQRFEPDTPMERYLVGGVLMGFGSMLAGGCAVGAGLSGGAILATTPWLAVFSMWAGAVLTEWVLGLRPCPSPA